MFQYTPQIPTRKFDKGLLFSICLREKHEDLHEKIKKKIVICTLTSNEKTKKKRCLRLCLRLYEK